MVSRISKSMTAGRRGGDSGESRGSSGEVRVKSGGSGGGGVRQHLFG